MIITRNQKASSSETPVINIFYLSFTKSDLVNNILNVNHNFNNKYVVVSVYNNLDKQVIPDEVNLIDSDTLTVDLSGFYKGMVGTWVVVVR